MRLWNDSEATCGRHHLSEVSSTSSSNLIHLAFSFHSINSVVSSCVCVTSSSSSTNSYSKIHISMWYNITAGTNIRTVLLNNQWWQQERKKIPKSIHVDRVYGHCEISNNHYVYYRYAMQYALMSYLGTKVMKYDTIGGHWCYLTPAYTQAYIQLKN